MIHFIYYYFFFLTMNQCVCAQTRKSLRIQQRHVVYKINRVFPELKWQFSVQGEFKDKSLKHEVRIN